MLIKWKKKKQLISNRDGRKQVKLVKSKHSPSLSLLYCPRGHCWLTTGQVWGCGMLSSLRKLLLPASLVQAYLSNPGIRKMEIGKPCRVLGHITPLPLKNLPSKYNPNMWTLSVSLYHSNWTFTGVHPSSHTDHHTLLTCGFSAAKKWQLQSMSTGRCHLCDPLMPLWCCKGVLWWDNSSLKKKKNYFT